MGFCVVVWFPYTVPPLTITSNHSGRDGVEVTTAVVVTVAVADAFVASVCAADSASPTMSGSRHDKLGRAHSTAEDAKRGRP